MEDTSKLNPQNMQTCAELSQPEVFEQLFERFGQKLYRYIYLHVRSKEDAEDVLSTSFIKLWEYVLKNPSGTVRSLSALMYRIARNLIIDQYRARRPTVSVEELLEQGIELSEFRSLDMTKRAELSLIFRSFEELEAQDRDLLLLRFVEDLPICDIADMHDITENNASVRIHRAVNKLREIISARQIPPI